MDVARRGSRPAPVPVRPVAPVRRRSTPRHRRRCVGGHERRRAQRRRRDIRRHRADRRQDDLDRDTIRVHDDASPSRLDRRQARCARERRRRCRHGRRCRQRRALRVFRCATDGGRAGLSRSARIPAAAEAGGAAGAARRGTSRSSRACGTGCGSGTARGGRSFACGSRRHARRRGGAGGRGPGGLSALGCGRGVRRPTSRTPLAPRRVGRSVLAPRSRDAGRGAAPACDTSASRRAGRRGRRARAARSGESAAHSVARNRWFARLHRRRCGAGRARRCVGVRVHSAAKAPSYHGSVRCRS